MVYHLVFRSHWKISHIKDYTEKSLISKTSNRVWFWGKSVYITIIWEKIIILSIQLGRFISSLLLVTHEFCKLRPRLLERMSLDMIIHCSEGILNEKMDENFPYFLRQVEGSSWEKDIFINPSKNGRTNRDNFSSSVTFNLDKIRKLTSNSSFRMPSI